MCNIGVHARGVKKVFANWWMNSDELKKFLRDCVCEELVGKSFFSPKKLYSIGIKMKMAKGNIQNSPTVQCL